MTTNTTDTDTRVATLDAIIRGRRTAKLMRDPAAEDGAGAPLADAHRAALDDMLELAGTAPFHKRSHEQTHRQGELASIVPWRFHVLERPACRQLLNEIERRAADEPDPKWARAAGSKIRDLIAAAGALVQVTWLPDPPAEGADAIADNDVEHVAAAAAAVQNLLLGAEARGWYGYWSSGGVLREPEIFDHLGIGREQRLLGAIFLTPPDGVFDRNIPGGLREQRGATRDWTRRVTLG